MLVVTMVLEDSDEIGTVVFAVNTPPMVKRDFERFLKYYFIRRKYPPMVKEEKSSLPLVKFKPTIQLSRKRRKYPPPIVNRLSVLEGGVFTANTTVSCYTNPRPVHLLSCLIFMLTILKLTLIQFA